MLIDKVETQHTLLNLTLKEIYKRKMTPPRLETYILKSVKANFLLMVRLKELLRNQKNTVDQETNRLFTLRSNSVLSKNP